MMKNYIQFPAAYNNLTEKVVPIEKVTDENKSNLVCPQCKNKFISIINHQTPHFKHKPESTCEGSRESYIHWLAKELFKEIEEFQVPEVFINDLPEKHRQSFQQIYNQTIDQNIPETLRIRFKKELKKNLSEEEIISINLLEIEKEYKTNLGDVQIDIVVNNMGNEMFIEPFYSNPINNEKKEKLSLLFRPTLSVNLKRYIEVYKDYFTTGTLTKYLISKKSKSWVHINENTYAKLIKGYERYLLEVIELNKEVIDQYKSELEKITKLESEIDNKYNKINCLEKEIDKMKNEIDKLKDENKIYY